MFDVIYYKNDTLVKVTGVKNSLTNAPINNATVEIVGIKKYGTTEEVNAEMFPLVLNYQTNSLGVYSGVLSNELDLEPNVKYTCMMQVTTTDNMKGYWEFSFTCRLRQD